MWTLRLCTALAFLAATCAAPCLAQAPVRAERPLVKVGDSTVFEELDVRTGEKRDTTFVVTAVDANKIVNEASGSTSGARTFTRDFNPLEIRTGEAVATTYRPYFPALQFPMEVGHSWSIAFEVNIPGQRQVSKWQMTAHVVSIEPITVPAGTFEAFRIEYEGNFTTQKGEVTFTGTHKEPTRKPLGLPSDRCA